MTTVRNFDVENVFCQDCISTIQNGKVLCLSDLCDVQIIGEATPPRNMRLTGGEVGSFGSTFLGINAGLRIFSGLGTGVGNTFVGYNSGILADASLRNTFVGSGAGELSTATADNVFVGHSTGGALAVGTGGNTFVGAQAGQAWDSSGAVFIGFNSGKVTISTGVVGNPNTFVGTRTGQVNTTGSSNTFVGWNAGLLNTTANYNTFVGDVSGGANTTGANNTFVGATSGAANTTGSNNVFLGTTSGSVNTTGSENVFSGSSAGASNTTGGDNTFVGFESGSQNTVGTSNTFVGASSGSINTTGTDNTYIGSASGSGVGFETLTGNTFVGSGTGSAGSANLSGNENTFVGYNSGKNYGTPVLAGVGQNTAVGAYSLEESSATPERDTAVGWGAMRNCPGGDDNVAVGWNALVFNNNSRNTVIGSSAGAGPNPGQPTSYSDCVYIGYQAYTGGLNSGIGGQNSVAIGSLAAKDVQSAAETVIIGYNTACVPVAGSIQNSVVIGANTTFPSGFNNSVAIGAGLLAANLTQTGALYFRPSLAATTGLTTDILPVVYNNSTGQMGPGVGVGSLIGFQNIPDSLIGSIPGQYLYDQFLTSNLSQYTTKYANSRIRVSMIFTIRLSKGVPADSITQGDVLLARSVGPFPAPPTVNWTVIAIPTSLVWPASVAGTPTDQYVPVSFTYVDSPMQPAGTLLCYGPGFNFTATGAGSLTIIVNNGLPPNAGLKWQNSTIIEEI